MSRGVALALAAVVLFPFAADAFELPHQLVLALGAAVALARGVELGRAAALAALAVVASALLAFATSQSAALSASALVTTLVLGLFAIAGRDLRHAPLLVAVWPVAGYALLQQLGADPLRWEGAAAWCAGKRPFSTLGHPTQLGLWTALCVPIALDEAVRAQGRRRAFFAATAAAACLTCVVSLSRAGWLALAAGVAAWVLLRRPRVAWLGLGLAAACGVAGALTGAALLERIEHFFTAPTRWQLWAAGWAGFVERPLLGWGLDTFVLVAQPHQHPEAWLYEWGGTALHAHSLVPQLLATQGLAGLLLYAAAGGAFAVALRRARRTPDALLHHGAAAAGLGFLAGELVAFSGVAVSALGLWCLMSADRGATVRAPRGLAALAVIAALATGLQLWASTEAQRALAEPARAAEHYARAASLEPWNWLWRARRGEVLEHDGALAEAQAAHEGAHALAPLVAQTDGNLGRVRSLRGDAQGSDAAFDAALARAPLDARIALDAVEAATSLGQLERAERLTVALLGRYPTDGPAYWALANVRALQGRTLEERAALEAGLEGDWRDWPEGAEKTRQRLAGLLFREGDVARATRYLMRPPPAAPAEICGAPARLALPNR